MIFTDLSSKRVIKVFKKIGFKICKKQGAKHIKLKKESKKLIIPRTNRLNPYTLKGIIKEARLSDEEFKRLL